MDALDALDALEAEARKKFELVKQTFLGQSQPWDVIAVPKNFDCWLRPELGLELSTPVFGKDKDKDEPEVYWRRLHIWYEVTGHVVSCASASRVIYSYFYKSKFVQAACQVLLANMSEQLLVSDDNWFSRHGFMQVTLVRRRWMSVARVAWVAAVVRRAHF